MKYRYLVRAAGVAPRCTFSATTKAMARYDYLLVPRPPSKRWMHARTHAPSTHPPLPYLKVPHLAMHDAAAQPWPGLVQVASAAALQR